MKLPDWEQAHINFCKLHNKPIATEKKSTGRKLTKWTKEKIIDLYTKHNWKILNLEDWKSSSSLLKVECTDCKKKYVKSVILVKTTKCKCKQK